MSEPYIRLKNICKSFGTVQANKNVSIDVSKGEILALLGGERLRQEHAGKHAQRYLHP